MASPTLITLDDNIYWLIADVAESPIAIVLAVFLVLAAVLAIMRLLAWRHEQKVLARMLEIDEAIQKKKEDEEEEQQASPEQIAQLEEREHKLKSMEDKVKGRRKSHLDEKERELREKEERLGPAVYERPGGNAGAVEEEEEMPWQEPDAQEWEEDYASKDWMKQPQKPAPSFSPFSPYLGGAVDDEEARLKKLIEMASRKYQDGQIDKEAYTQIIVDYQKRLLELEVEKSEAGVT